MAEAAVAFGLAVNALQVVDYGIKFLATAWNIWKSGKEGVDGLVDLQLVSQDVRAVVKELETAPSSSSHPLNDGSNERIMTLAKECGEISQRILDSVESLGIPGKGRRKRQAIVAAARLAWKYDEIMALQARLADMKSEITLNLNISLRSCMMKSLENQDVIKQQLAQSHKDNHKLKSRIEKMADDGEGLGSTLVRYLVWGADSTWSRELAQSIFDGLLEAVYNSEKYHNSDASAFKIGKSRRATLERKFLSKLQYDGMQDRELTVVEAHQTTFRWILEQEDDQQRPWTNFRHWLESDQQLYWITGKAGSGKSTLMRFITQPVSSNNAISATDEEPRCSEYLLRWAKGRRIVFGAFYFWAAGMNIQSSKEGLYRTLLYQILRHCPEAIPHVCPERWEALCLFNEDPRSLGEGELRNILLKTARVVSSTASLCLFIDGLDEFNGRHDDLIRLVQELLATSPIKICVGSRPWLVFEDALSSQSNLRLEDLTHDDIKEYVMTRFQSDAEFGRLREQEADFSDDLVDNVVGKASGVFLWVDLVVTSLLDGMRSGDRACDLQRRLDQLPGDLESLYDDIFGSIDPLYLEHAAQYFQMMQACD
ncbi:p-loop containing nucleoside triphosphate hydrolase [Pleurostoma richardsiae]|uniref:P-loop containing nucleoside triphosphate hydrolase n=1 Tax=Pleurostoma richardsiae TaxID=41990 RepID=A0AA38RIT7_9PEZI|nr:p-loop containing nucleoside triphosphate hydrolase [Pleurostoma richardsiae]